MKYAIRHRICSALLLAAMLFAIPASMLALAVPAAAAEIITIPQTEPAIRADVGQSIDLSAYRLQIAPTSYLEPEKMTWSSEELAISGNKVTAPQKGVYTLSVTNGAIVRKVYLVVKEPSETEYVLYENDFTDAASIGSWKKLQQTSGASYSVANGKLTMNASDATSSYIRLMLPEFLGDFGNYRFEAQGTITKAQNDKRYLALMFRIQNKDYPYYQMCVRQNATYSNGTEFAERTEKNAWNVTHTSAYTSKLSATGNYVFAVDVCGNAVATSINGERLIYTKTATKYTRGAPGLQVNGCSASFTSVKVTLTDGVEPTRTKLAQVRDPKSNLRQTPSIVSYLNDLKTVMTDSPATAVLRVNSALEVLDEKGTKLSTVAETMKVLDQKVIPAFYVQDEATVKALCAYLKKEDIIDAFVMAQDAALVRLARDTYTPIRGIVDFSRRTDTESMTMAKIREATNAARARVAVLPASLATQANVEALQRLFITVWVQSTLDDTVELVSHITSGANGIITQNRAELERCFTAYFHENTISRVVNVIGHRGQPSTGQENSIASSMEAYEAGATMVENDIYISTDGVVVVMHDSTIDRTTNGSGNVESMPVSVLQKYVIDGKADAPTQPIPTLEDYFKEFKGKDLQLIVEIKSGKEALLKPVIELIQKYDILDQVNVITFKADQIQRLKALYPEISIGYLTSAITLSEEEPLLTVEQILEAVQVYDTTFNPSYAGGALGPNVMTAAGHRGITFWPYTINDSAHFDTYFMYGANGITTNYSYWVSDYIKNVTTAESSYTVEVGRETFIPVNCTTYSRETTEKTTGSISVISGNEESISYKKGQLTVTEAGEYTVLFRHACSLNNGKVYYMYSQPVTIRATSSEAAVETTVPAVEQTPPAEEPGDTKEAPAGNATPIVISAVVAAVVLLSGAVVWIAIKKK
ncbi:MAG: glycerophosphodiester phosphodiesterase [Clostridia bacterium]|nr:glycerophosphodiester phosphodiesterase [Clostridia bacterium]